MCAKSSGASVKIPKISFTHPFLTDFDFHLPCCLNNLSVTLVLAAADAPPNRKLCREKNFVFIRSTWRTWRKHPLPLTYDTGLVFFFKALFWGFAIDFSYWLKYLIWMETTIYKSYQVTPLMTYKPLSYASWHIIPANLVIFTEEILNGKLRFLYSVLLHMCSTTLRENRFCWTYEQVSFSATTSLKNLERQVP